MSPKVSRMVRWCQRVDWVVRPKDSDLPFGQVHGVRWCEEHAECVLLLMTAEGQPFTLHESEVEHAGRQALN